uniref:LysM domain-containing protein n=1 Tax=Streptomyces avermitilis TaxID=33903 RepID=A0A499VAA7_STRAX|nr:hypothetical protein SAVMC3_40540 [Streptomyces avermitilis]
MRERRLLERRHRQRVLRRAPVVPGELGEVRRSRLRPQCRPGQPLPADSRRREGPRRQGQLPWSTCGIAVGLSQDSGSADVDTGLLGSGSTADSDSGSGISSGLSDSSSSSGSSSAAKDSKGSAKADATPSGSSTSDSSSADAAKSDDSDKSGQNGDASTPSEAESTSSGRHRGDTADESAADGRADDSTGRHASRGSDGSREAAPDAADDAYVVRPGDSLSAIADSLGLRGGWSALYTENEKTVGADPDVIVPGQSLALAAEPGEKQR